MKAARAAAAAAGLLACSICCLACCKLLLLATARDPTISGLAAPSVTTYPTTSSCLPPQPSVFLPLISLSLLTFSTQKRPKCALLCLVGSKTPLWLWVAHFTWQPGSCWSTTKVRTFSFPVVPVRESNWLHRAARRLSRAGSGLGPDRHSPPDQIRYSNGTRQALFFS